MYSDAMAPNESGQDVEQRITETKEGIRVFGKIKRGTGTRDQDELGFRAYAEDMDEAEEKMETGVQMLRSEARKVRLIQPDVSVEVE